MGGAMSYKRKRGESGIYHVITRGVAQKDIFHDDGDRRHYLRKLKELQSQYEVKMLAWCLMSNHVHLLPKAESINRISDLMRDLSADYSSYYNWRYERAGHLVQGRFKSKPVEDEAYLMTVVRYIHQNPVGKITATCDYRWSSYQEYVGRHKPIIASIEDVLNMFGGREEFIKFHREKGEPDGSLDPDKRMRLSDDEAHDVALEVAGAQENPFATNHSRDLRDEVIRTLHDRGLSYRQIASETGMNRSNIARICQIKPSA